MNHTDRGNITMKSTIKPGTIARTVMLFIALFNMILSCFGYQIIDVDDETVNNLITASFTIVSSIVCWWKNNSFTESAIIADEILNDMKWDDKNAKTR